MKRREFIAGLGGLVGASMFMGCTSQPHCALHRARLALQLGSVRDYILGKVDETGRIVSPGAGLAKTFRALSAMGYQGVQFSDYFHNDAKTLKSMLSDAGLEACGSLVACAALAPDRIAETCDFNLNFGNNLLVCSPVDIADQGFLNRAAEAAAKCGCRIALQVDAALLATDLSNLHSLLSFQYDVTSTDALQQAIERQSRRASVIQLQVGSEIDWSELISIMNENNLAWCVLTCHEPASDLSFALAPVVEWQTRWI